MESDSVPIPPESKQVTWIQSWPAVIAMLATIAGGGIAAVKYAYSFGQRVEKNDAKAVISEKNTEITLLKSQIENDKQEMSRLNKTISDWQTAYNAAQGELLQRRESIVSLTERLGRNNSCVFLQEQILAAKKEMDTSPYFTFPLSEDQKKDEAERQAKLQKVIDGYTQQIGTVCKG